MKREEIIAAIDEAIEAEEVHDWTSDVSPDENICRLVFDRCDDRDLCFTAEEDMSIDWLLPKVHVQEKTFQEFSVDIEALMRFLFDALPREFFTLFRGIYFISNDEGLSEIYNETGDEAALDLIDLENQMGLEWWERHICLVNLPLCVQTALEIWDSYGGEDPAIPTVEAEVAFAIESTVVHELRHMMLDNPYLDEEKYPEFLAEEQEVENWSSDFAHDHLLTDFVTTTEKEEENTTMESHVRFVEYRAETYNNCTRLQYFWEGTDMGTPSDAVKKDLDDVLSKEGFLSWGKTVIHTADVLGRGTPYVYDFIEEDKGNGHWVAYGADIQKQLNIPKKDICGFLLREGICIGFDKQEVEDDESNADG